MPSVQGSFAVEFGSNAAAPPLVVRLLIKITINISNVDILNRFLEKIKKLQNIFFREVSAGIMQ